MRRIGGIILAAGGSTRLGQPKQLLNFHGETLVHAAVRAAQEGGCDSVCVVTGCAQEAVKTAIADLSPLLVHNENWERGMGSSIRRGIAGVQVQPLSAVVLLVCDQPAVDASVVRALIDQYERTALAMVASHYAGTFGTPALFDASLFDALQQLPDDRGAKTVITANPTQVAALDFPAGALDIDSPADVHAWHVLAHR